MRLHEAQNHAEWLVDLLGPACLQTAIAGSIRRGKAMVKDIELVVEPICDHTANLFGEVASQVSRLDGHLHELVATGALAFDRVVKRDGPKYKRLVIVGREDTPIDLFIANAANWGNILAIRTGNADFSKALVTSRVFGGLMPTDMQQRDGTLWRGRQPLECFTEADFFRALDLAHVPDPVDRDGDLARRLARRVVARPP